MILQIGNKKNENAFPRFKMKKAYQRGPSRLHIVFLAEKNAGQVISFSYSDSRQSPKVLINVDLLV